jgi:hypothetical protein
MKIAKITCTLLVFTMTCFVQAQNKNAVKAEKSTVKSENLLDMQTNLLTNVFGENMDGQTQGEGIGYLELIENMDISLEKKEEMTNIYYLQAKEPNQKTKDSLGSALEQKMKEAQLEKE